MEGENIRVRVSSVIEKQRIANSGLEKKSERRRERDIERNR